MTKAITGFASPTAYGSLAVLALACMFSVASHAMPRQQTIATELQEVRTGTLNGREFLTIRILDDVGPLACRGRVLKVDTANLPRVDGHTELESVALSAMLNHKPVVITVPTAAEHCLDGKPTITDMYVLPSNL